MEEDYVQLPVPGKQGPHGSTTGRGAIGPLPALHPTPLSRLIFRDLKLLITLNQEEEQAGESATKKMTNSKSASSQQAHLMLHVCAVFETS